MSSYRPFKETHTLAEMLGLATADIMKLHDEISDLCATIAAQFPDTHENIPKYRQAYHTLSALSNACLTLEEPLDRIDPPLRRQAVTITIDKQMRSNRSASQRVRLGNSIVRLRGAMTTLAAAGEVELRDDLAENIATLETVEFPQTYG